MLNRVYLDALWQTRRGSAAEFFEGPHGCWLVAVVRRLFDPIALPDGGKRSRCDVLRRLGWRT